MKLEHVAIDVADSEATIAWWCANLGFRRVAPASPFIVDDSGVSALEIYRASTTSAAPDYSRMDAMTLHIALVSADVRSDAERLVAAGARLEKLNVEKADFHIAFMRDPSGIPFQLCRRAPSIFKEPKVS